MRLENRVPAEGINSSPENPLSEFAWLLGGSLAILVTLVLAVSFAAQWIAPRVPYRYEAKLAAALPSFATAPDTDTGRAVQAELQALADRLAAHISLPAGMTVKIGYRDERIVNAFATLGGQAVFFRGLLARIDSENALAMVMAHELAHLKHRHASAALGRGVAVGVILSAISADLGSNAANSVLGTAGLTTLLSFNRDQEREADDTALRALLAEYGHVGGALDLFALLQPIAGEKGPAGASIEFLRTHPLTASRITSIEQWAKQHGVPVDGSRRPLPAAIAGLADR